tara:strand:+ start:428 stop:796 length:369 start_codon:yes stop_codon:yes gene_type:complete
MKNASKVFVFAVVCTLFLGFGMLISSVVDNNERSARNSQMEIRKAQIEHRESLRDSKPFINFVQSQEVRVKTKKYSVSTPPTPTTTKFKGVKEDTTWKHINMNTNSRHFDNLRKAAEPKPNH